MIVNWIMWIKLFRKKQLNGITYFCNPPIESKSPWAVLFEFNED